MDSPKLSSPAGALALHLIFIVIIWAMLVRGTVVARLRRHLSTIHRTGSQLKQKISSSFGARSQSRDPKRRLRTTGSCRCRTKASRCQTCCHPLSGPQTTAHKQSPRVWVVSSSAISIWPRLPATPIDLCPIL